jgi:xanthine dehydrogenase YagR molybdenum-binding subunit
MIGQPLDRVDGPLKVTGGAKYSYERVDFGRAVSGYMVGAAIGKGRVETIDVSRAERAPGVLLVLTHRNVPPQAARNGNSPEGFGRAWPVLESDRIAWFGQPVALVVADTFERARSAAALIDIAYLREDGAFKLASHVGRAYAPRTANVGLATDVALGDLDRAMAEGAVVLDQTYVTPAHFAQPMEPQACVAHWIFEDLHVRASLQTVSYARLALARTFQIPPERVHLDAAFVGGGFGSKLRVHDEGILAALAAKILGVPVKVAQTRRQAFTVPGRRPEMIHRVRLAADREGRLLGIGHDATMQGTERELFVEQTATVLRSLYAAPNRLTRHRVVNLDVGFGEPVRGPGELPGMLATESAVDQLAHDLDIDPIELRVRNEPALDPEKGVPLNGRRLVECMRVGAARFGWADRERKPGQRREGEFLIGMGMAAAIRMHFQGASQALVRLQPDGRAVARCDMTDIGTGTYTILGQVVADTLGLPMERVTVELARSDLPPTGGSGGSWGAANSANAVHRACLDLKARVLGPIDGPGEGRDLVGEVARRFPNGVEGSGSIVGMAEDPNYRAFSQHTYGASFAEVAVSALTGEVRLRRMLGVFAAGRIINPKTARSQLMGGMIWGVSSALHEAAHLDPRDGHVVNGDLAEYLVPVHADIPTSFDAVLLDDFDDKANPLGMKGVGELGVCGTGAAVANAVFNATGVRVLEFPITLDKLLPALAERDA